MLFEVEGHDVKHLPLNHWLGTKAYASPSSFVNQQLAPSGHCQPPTYLCSKSLESILTDIDVTPQLRHPGATAAEAVGSNLVVHVSGLARWHPQTSGMGPTLDIPQQTHAAFQLLFHLRHPSWKSSDPHQQLAAVGEHELLVVYHSVHQGGQRLSILSVHCPAMLTHLSGDLRFATSRMHVAAAVTSTAVVLQPLPAWSDVVALDSCEQGMCLLQDKPFTNETVGLLPSGPEATPSGWFFTLQHCMFDCFIVQFIKLMTPICCHVLLELYTVHN